MTIFVVTDSRIVRTAFAAAERSRTYSVEFSPLAEASRVIRDADAIPDSFLYIDADGMDRRTMKRRLTRLCSRRPYRFGIIDAKHQIIDVAELFHHCAADYVGKALLNEGLSTARLRRVVEFQPEPLQGADPCHVPEHESHQLIPSGSDWSGVQHGREYTFVMLYAGIDRAGDLRGESSEGLLALLRKTFSEVLERSFAEYGARTWMWKEDEGLLLMPFDGRTVDAIIPALRLLLNRVLINAEEFSRFDDLSWRLALHLGNTTYRSTGSTGDIVSESVNFLFHLGARFVEPGGLAVTGPCYAFVPDRIRALLNHRGEFESVHVYTLRDLL